MRLGDDPTTRCFEWKRHHRVSLVSRGLKDESWGCVTLVRSEVRCFEVRRLGLHWFKITLRAGAGKKGDGKNQGGSCW